MVADAAPKPPPTPRDPPSVSATSPGRYDVVVVGSGFGGLGAALRLAESGVRVHLIERLDYPGGCAATFSRGQHRFEAGATLFSGFAKGQLFERWIDRHQLDVTIDWLDPVIQFRCSEFELAMGRAPGALGAALSALPGAPIAALHRFFDRQQRVAGLVWDLLDEPRWLPPFDLRALRHHLRSLGPALKTCPLIGRPLSNVVESYGLTEFRPLRVILDALCQITVQCDHRRAEAVLALAALDYVSRGTAHVRGGIGNLARGLVSAIERLGGSVQFTDEVRRIERRSGLWSLTSRRGVVEAPHVVANVLPQTIARWLDHPLPVPWNSKGDDLLRHGYGACMLFVTTAATSDHPVHLQIVTDVDAPFVEGRHIFCSLSGPRDGPRAPNPTHRSLTVSTHVPMATLLGLSDGERPAYIQTIQDRMRDGLKRHAPELYDARVAEWPGSPRTFERFTGRPHGLVGGPPRFAGWRNYLEAWRGPILPGLHIVGDSTFPGQSTLATALGGVKVAERILRGR